MKKLIGMVLLLLILLVGTAVTTVVSNASGWSIVLEADDTNDRLAVKVTGEASKTINWKAKITSSVVS